MRAAASFSCIVMACQFEPGVPAPAVGGDDAATRDDAAVTVVADASPDGRPDASTCPLPYVRSMHGCHFFTAIAATTWQLARAGCQATGGDLPIVDNLGESNYIATATGGLDTRVWIGLSGTGTDGSTWTWLDGQTVAQKGYSRWNTGEPNSGETCAVIRPEGTWAGRLCTESWLIVCERTP